MSQVTRDMSVIELAQGSQFKLLESDMRLKEDE